VNPINFHWLHDKFQKKKESSDSQEQTNMQTSFDDSMSDDLSESSTYNMHGDVRNLQQYSDTSLEELTFTEVNEVVNSLGWCDDS